MDEVKRRGLVRVGEVQIPKPVQSLLELTRAAESKRTRRHDLSSFVL